MYTFIKINVKNISQKTLNNLKFWKNRKIGIKNIGKSFIVRGTASRYYKNHIEINLKEDN